MLYSKSLKLVEHFIYLGNNISSTESDVNICIEKAWSGPGSNGNEGVLHIPQSSRITGTSPSDCLVSYPGLPLRGGGLTPLQRCSWCILGKQICEFELKINMFCVQNASVCLVNNTHG